MERSIGNGGRPIQIGWRRAKKLAVVAIWISLPISALYFFLASIGLAPNPYICLTSTVDNITSLPGHQILIVETDCDTIAKWDLIKIYVSRPGENKSDLVFEYDPMDVNRLPTFSVDAEGSLSISIAAVATVWRQIDEWNGQKITYRIGKEYYPEGARAATQGE